MKDKFGYYFIFLVHLITLTVKINFTEYISKFYEFSIPINVINELSKNILKNDKVLDSGKINIITLINVIGFFLIGNNFYNMASMIILSILLIEGLTFYFNETSQIATSLVASIIAYIFGLYFNNKRRYIKIESNRIYDDELTNNY